MAQQKARLAGKKLFQLNDSNPTHHGLGPGALPEHYDADPRGERSTRNALAEFLSARVKGSDAERETQRCPLDSLAQVTKSSKNTVLTFEASGGSVDPDSLYLTSSTSQAYSWLMKLLCDPGEAVLCPTPGYPLIDSIGRLEAVKAITYPLDYDGSWTINVSDVKESLEKSRNGELPPIRALILINPNNPTGSYVHSQDYGQLVALCERYDVAIIADEVFFDFPLLPLETPQRVTGESRVLTFGLDGFSKMLAAPHAKVGWIQVSGPREDTVAAQKRLDVIADDFLPMSAIITEKIPDMIAQIPAQLLRVRQRCRTNLINLESLLESSESGVTSLLRPEGGWNVLLRFPSTIDENKLILSLIKHHGITAQPGYFFDMTQNGYVAVSLLAASEDFLPALSALLISIDALLEF